MDRSYLIKVDKVFDSLIKWDKQGKWDRKESPAAILNELWRICKNSDDACDIVYNYIVNCDKIDESALCKQILYNDKYDKLFGNVTKNLIQMFDELDDELFEMLDVKATNAFDNLCKYNHISYSDDIQGKKSYVKSYSFPQMDRNKLESLYNICQKSGLIGRLIYSQPILSINLLTNVLTHLKKMNFQQETLCNPLNAIDQKFAKDAYRIIFSYCSLNDLLQFIFVNRYWHHIISEWTFVKKCRAFKKFILDDEQVENYDNLYSSRWVFQDWKWLSILSYKETLLNSKFGELNGTNIQVLECSYKYFTELPHELKGLSILCDDDTLDDVTDYDLWDVFDWQQKPLIFTVINYDPCSKIQQIPNTKALLWDSSTVMTHLIVECIAKPTIEWIGLQTCETMQSLTNVKSDPKADYSEYFPSTKVYWINSKYYFDFMRLLDNKGTYHKYVSSVTIVTEWFEVQWETWNFWDFLITIYNDNCPKKIVILFTWDKENSLSLEDEHRDRLDLVFDWIKSVYEQVKKQKSIGEFTFGLISKYNNQQRGHAFDVKKCTGLACIKGHKQVWERILLNEKSIVSTHKWFAKLNKITQEIPRK